jgi:hypothetical protein
MVSQQTILENFPMDHQEKNNYANMKWFVLQWKKYNNPPSSQWEHYNKIEKHWSHNSHMKNFPCVLLFQLQNFVKGFHFSPSRECQSQI